uniref:Uncharacterized protein n=1 Tax=Glossina pallidipes TaxID=7398 RepID=A0A1B0A1H5_GLOPL
MSCNNAGQSLQPESILDPCSDVNSTRLPSQLQFTIQLPEALRASLESSGSTKYAILVDESSDADTVEGPDPPRLAALLQAFGANTTTKQSNEFYDAAAVYNNCIN